jgi:hypothetical protein
MNRLAVALIVVLLIANTSGTVVLLTRAPSTQASRLTDAQLAQADKLFTIVADFQRELENVTGQASYEDDKERTAAKNDLRDRTLLFTQSRIDHDRLKKSARVDDFVIFVQGVLYSRRGWMGVIDPPTFSRFVAAKFDTKFNEVTPSKTVQYANVSKLEALQDEFKVLSKSLLDDIK